MTLYRVRIVSKFGDQVINDCTFPQMCGLLEEANFDEITKKRFWNRDAVDTPAGHNLKYVGSVTI